MGSKGTGDEEPPAGSVSGWLLAAVPLTLLWLFATTATVAGPRVAWLDALFEWIIAAWTVYAWCRVAGFQDSPRFLPQLKRSRTTWATFAAILSVVGVACWTLRPGITGHPDGDAAFRCTLAAAAGFAWYRVLLPR